jgi:2-C-methyl-D-erythritol 4-phosphate cytidylyltransferase
VPAAGVGRRMRARVPKQYLPLNGQALLLHTLKRLQQHPQVRGVVVAISAGDEYWPAVEAQLDLPVLVAPGGDERAHTVRNALAVLARVAAPVDWVLVHDAARPCVRTHDISKLLASVAASDAAGGFLAMPVRDTMKRTDDLGRVLETVPRERLWHALTPQLFRLGMLAEALDRARASGREVTDEASAMEFGANAVLAVEGHTDNLKITHPADLALAESFIAAQAQERTPT